MKTVYCIITNLGDGSNGLEWYKDTSLEILESLEDNDPYGTYASGDGIQINKITFPEYVNLDDIKGIYWNDEELKAR